MVVAITKWVTSDGKEFNDEHEAKVHEQFHRLTRYFPVGREKTCSGLKAEWTYQVLTHLLREGHIVARDFVEEAARV